MDLTGKYPDIIDFMPKCTAPGVTSFVIDSEAVIIIWNLKQFFPHSPLCLALTPTKLRTLKTLFHLQVAFNRETRKILPFQTLQNRSRKGVKLEDVTIHVCLFAFDILYLNGEPLLRKTLRERREALYKSFVPTDGMLTFTTSATRAVSEPIKLVCTEQFARTEARADSDLFGFDPGNGRCRGDPGILG